MRLIMELGMNNIVDFIKIFFPAGTKRHYILKKAYFKLRGWPINF